MNGLGGDEVAVSSPSSEDTGLNDSLTNVPQLKDIIAALEIVHGPRSSNQARKEASIYLEERKNDANAPMYGFTLAYDRSKNSVVRHYALSLLEHSIKHRWLEYSVQEAETVRKWVVKLAQHVTDQDPSYIRNKTSLLWIEILKRIWGLEWADMDKQLVELWGMSLVQKEIVLVILETISEDVFNREDTVAGLRGHELSRACVDIFTPVAIFKHYYPDRQEGLGVRCGDEGWLFRLGLFLDWCMDNNVLNDPQVQTCAVKAILAIKAAIPWAPPKAIASVHCVERICRGLATPSLPVQMASIEALHTISGPSLHQHNEIVRILCSLFKTESVLLLKKLYEWCIVNPSDIDDQKYLFLKKFSETMSQLGDLVVQKPRMIPDDSDIANFLLLFLSILRNQSLIVSIPILHSWVKLLRCEALGGSGAVATVIGPLLETCSQRMLRYEYLPEDSEDPSILFLNEDFDTYPERHAFLGNYRRYCANVIEIVVEKTPLDAIQHILSQVDSSLNRIYEGEAPFSVETYRSRSVPVLRADSQISVVDSALKGYSTWVSTHGANPQEDENIRNSIDKTIRNWCEHLMAVPFEDPIIRKQVLELAVDAATKAFKSSPSFAVIVLENLLITRPTENPSFAAYSDAVKELQTMCTHGLHKLAMSFPDYLYSVYDQIEMKVSEIINTEHLDERQAVHFRTLLFVINHRANDIAPALREQRLETFLAPVKDSWREPGLEQALATLEGFFDMLGLSKVCHYLTVQQVHKVENWSTYLLDQQGLDMQKEINERSQLLPLRPTKSFLGVSTEKTKKDSLPYKFTYALWKDSVHNILPNLLQFLRHAHAAHNPNNWKDLPEEMHCIVERILTERFWQAGISSGSKGDFYAKVSSTRKSMEGLASSIRGTLRSVRETCYSILYCMSRLDDIFYGMSDLPDPLAYALFEDADSLSSHQFSTLLSMVRYIVDDCPTELREQFLPPIVATLFSKVDAKTRSEWDRIVQRNEAQGDEDDLSNEMRDESILRQLTFSAVTMVASLLDPRRENPATNGPSSTNQSQNMRSFILSSPRILEPVILFCTHVLRMRDNRCCGIIIRVFASIVGEFSGDDPAVAGIRDFISNEVLKACITSLHEPYFVDLQKELAQLIARIYILYTPTTDIPKNILLSLPGITEDKFNRFSSRLYQSSSARQQRASVLDLLEGLRGVSISEMGKIARPDPKKVRSAMQEKYMTVDHQEHGPRNSPDLSGVADMFG